jgi:alanine-glyoxylate transaminase/serine-glyoxylate transaminase/serine-pyruvate transaminase
MVPKGINGAEVISIAYQKYNVSLGAGLSEVAGKLFRIGHLGSLNEVSCCAALAGAEMAMLDVGMKIKPGSGVGAAIEYYRKNAPKVSASGKKASQAAQLAEAKGKKPTEKRATA